MNFTSVIFICIFILNLVCLCIERVGSSWESNSFIFSNLKFHTSTYSLNRGGGHVPEPDWSQVLLEYFSVQARY
jgi:hypothetical protein